MLKRLFFLLYAGTILAQSTIIFEVKSLGFSPGSRISITYPSIFRTNSNAKVSATVGGKPAYIVGHNPFGIDAQIPFELEAGATTLIVTVDGTQLAPFNLRLETFAPGISSCTGDSRCDFGSFLNFNGRFIGPQTPAVPGDPLLATATGLGPTNPPTATGPSPSTRPTANPVTLTIGGKAAEVTFAGLGVSAIGDYSLNFKVPAGLQGTQPLTVTVGGKTSAPVNIPLFGISSVVSNASFGSRGIAAPGSIVSVFANGLGSINQLTGFPATNFQGVSVSFGGRSAPLFHLTPGFGQIDLLVPSELPSSGTVDVQLTTPTGTSNYPLLLASAVPAFYRLADPFNAKQVNVIAQFSGTAWLALPASMAFALNVPGNCTERKADPAVVCVQPAAIGDFLVLYATGLGKATPNGDPNGPPLPTGTVPPANGSVLYKTVVSPTVTIGGVPAAVLYSGLAPGFPGLYQVNVQVPNGVAAGDEVPVVLSLPGAASDNSVTLAVR